MTDLVERLRLMAGPLSAGLSKSGRLAECLPACLEAADEIERLRGALQAIHEHALMGHDDAADGFIKICGMVRDALNGREALTGREDK